VADPREVHRNATRTLSVIMVVIGIVLLATTLARGGGPFTGRVLIGILFVLAGALRFVMAGRGRA
jgi:hypothetical protein